MLGMSFIIFSKHALKAQNIILKNGCGIKLSFTKKNFNKNANNLFS